MGYILVGLPFLVGENNYLYVFASTTTTTTTT